MLLLPSRLAFPEFLAFFKVSRLRQNSTLYALTLSCSGFLIRKLTIKDIAEFSKFERWRAGPARTLFTFLKAGKFELSTFSVDDISFRPCI